MTDPRFSVGERVPLNIEDDHWRALWKRWKDASVGHNDIRVCGQFELFGFQYEYEVVGLLKPSDILIEITTVTAL